jgi:hypothetical protein
MALGQTANHGPVHLAGISADEATPTVDDKLIILDVDDSKQLKEVTVQSIINLGGSGTGWQGEVNDYASLPAATGSGDVYLVKNSTGIFWNQRKGLYLDEGTWNRLSNPTFKVLDSETQFYDDLDTTKILQLQLSSITTGNTRTITMRDSDLNLGSVDKWSFDLAGTTVSEGDLAWDADAGTLKVGMPGGNVNLQVGQEQHLAQRPKNVEAVQINNGEAVYISGATGATPEVMLANASLHDTSHHTIAIATENVAASQRGYYTSFGAVRDFDTTFGSDGDTVYLDTTDGQLTATKPDFPNFAVEIGTIFRSHATEGVLNVNIKHDAGNDIIDFHNGTFRESFDATVSSDGATITMSLEKSGGGDLNMMFSDGMTVLDCTPAQTIALTAGTTNSPQSNFIYILESTKVLTKSTTAWPSAEHIKVGYFYAQSAVDTQSDGGTLINQNWNDHIADTDLRGHLTHIGQAIRLGTGWNSGVAPNGTSDYLTIAAGSVTVQSTSGVIYQMHEQSFPAKDTSVSDDVHVVNGNATDGGAFFETSNLDDITVDTTGATLNNRWCNLVLWGVVNKTGQYMPLMINIPTGSYASQTGAENDASGTTVFSVPREFNKDSGTAFLIARITVRVVTGGTWTYGSYIDLRGQTPVTATGGVVGAVTDFADNQITIFNNADNTKIIDFDASAITTGNTRTITMADGDIDLGNMVSSTSTITDNAVTRGDGGAKGVQQSGVIIDDSDNMSAITQLDAERVVATKTTTNADTVQHANVGDFQAAVPTNVVTAGVYGYMNNTGALSPGTGHGIGVLGLAEDTATSTHDMYGCEGRVNCFGDAAFYYGTLGYVLFEGTTFTGQVAIGLQGRVEITTDGSTALNEGVAVAVYAPAITGGAAATKYSFWGADVMRMDNQIYSSLTTGTAPFLITSTTLNANLNADLLDGQEGTYYENEVTKSGTPANNQIAVWTGDGPIEGGSDLTYDGNTLDVDGKITAGTQTISYAASITPNLNSGTNIKVGQLTGDITVNAMTNTADGASGYMRFNADATDRTITWNADYLTAGGFSSTVVPASTTTMVYFMCDGTDVHISVHGDMS